jgi:thiol-disulfide isomerase/thioredoxin
VFAAAAIAGTGVRGWTEGGTVALGASRVLTPPEPIDIELPKGLTDTLDGPTVLVYFSSSCPHCRDVAPELNELAAELGDSATIVGVASGTNAKEEVEEFIRTFKVRFRIVHDSSREIGSAMGARSTPSALMVVPKGKKAWQIREVWYPYRPGYKTLVRIAASDNPWSAFEKGAYYGVSVCASCHLQEAEAWSLSHHSVAMRTLVKHEKHEDPECIGCHVTGHETAGGWDPTTREHLVDVGCESCHGPGGPHDGERSEPKDACEGCHDAKHSIAFAYDKGLPLLDHFKTVGMTDETYRAERTALLNGEAERELLAFREGDTVGADACAECHPAEHAGWKTSPHGQAMKRLHDDGKADDVACVTCHGSTKRAGGPRPTELEGFHTDAGVGCESCHGPGDLHVAEGGGTGNIEALGEDCPVCVLEAICTSCHTKKWDPTWDLDVRLESVKGYHVAPEEPAED